jgi:hypothetical protein
MPKVEISRSDSYGTSHVVLEDPNGALIELIDLAQVTLDNMHAKNTRVTTKDVTL